MAIYHSRPIIRLEDLQKRNEIGRWTKYNDEKGLKRGNTLGIQEPRLKKERNSKGVIYYDSPI